MHHEHGYLNPFQNGSRQEQEAARRAQEAASTMGRDHVNAQLQELQRRGADERMQQEAAMQLQAEAAYVRNMNETQARQGVAAQPTAPTHQEGATVKPSNPPKLFKLLTEPTPSKPTAVKAPSLPKQPIREPVWQDYDHDTYAGAASYAHAMDVYDKKIGKVTSPPQRPATNYASSSNAAFYFLLAVAGFCLSFGLITGYENPPGNSNVTDTVVWILAIIVGPTIVIWGLKRFFQEL